MIKMTGFLWDQYLFLIFLRALQSLLEGGRPSLGLTKGNPAKKWVCLFVWVLPLWVLLSRLTFSKKQ